MALTVSAVTPTATNRTATATTFVMTDIGAAFAINDMVVVCIACDNSFTGGAATTITSVTDGPGNTYTSRRDVVYDPGTINSGIANAIFTSSVTRTLVSTDDLTITFRLTTAAVAVTIWKIANDGIVRAVYSNAGTGTGASSAAPTVTTASITNGDIVIGHYAGETNEAVTADADATNGSWSAQSTATGNTGTVATSARGATQVKTVTATATQTYNPTTAVAADQILTWISLTSEPLPVTKGIQLGQAVQRASVY
jgi:hypothetical protein